MIYYVFKYSLDGDYYSSSPQDTIGTLYENFAPIVSANMPSRFVAKLCGETGFSPSFLHAAVNILFATLLRWLTQASLDSHTCQSLAERRGFSRRFTPNNPQSAEGILYKPLPSFAHLSKLRFAHLSKSCGETGIRTPETLLEFTRFPGVPLQPLEHLSIAHLCACFIIGYKGTTFFANTQEFL